MISQSIKKNVHAYLSIAVLLILLVLIPYVFTLLPLNPVAEAGAENSSTANALSDAIENNADSTYSTPVTIKMQTPDTGNLEDAKVRSSFANNNYGTDAYLETYLTAFGDKRRTFIKYNISGIPVGSRVKNFSVCFYHYSNYLSEIRTIDLHKVNNYTWSEHEITWNSQPGWTDTYIATLNFSVGDIYEWRCFTSPGGSKWITSDDIAAGNVSFMIKDSVEEKIPAGWYIYSKESDLSQRPYLEITYLEQ